MVVSTATSSNGDHAGASVSGGLENDIMQGTMPGARRRGRPRTACRDGQHQDVDRTPRGRVSQNDRGQMEKVRPWCG